jgi:hypothetical protein
VEESVEPPPQLGAPISTVGSTDSSTLNLIFDEAVASGKVYHLMWHPQAIWTDLDAPYFTDHLAHISGHGDVWYGYLGQVYLYHLIEKANRAVLTTLTVPEARAGASRLGQNFPNPFRSATTIEFEVADRAHVSLQVFDVLGKRVATLVDGATEPGRHTLSWDARKVPSGTYFCQLEVSRADGSGGMVESTRKMMRVR